MNTLLNPSRLFWTCALLVGLALLAPPAPAFGQSQLTVENLAGAPFHDRVVLSRIGSLAAPPSTHSVHDQSQIQLRNTGSSSLQITDLSNTGQFQLVNPPTLPTTIAPGAFLDVTIRYIAESGNQSGGNRGRHSGTLTITNDSPQPSVAVELSGYWQTIPEGGFEPRLVEIVEQIFGYDTEVLLPGEAINNQGRIETVGDEVLSPYWKRTNTAFPATVQQLVAYHTPNAARFYWHPKGSMNTTQVKRHAEAYMQSVLPHNFNDPSVTTVGSFTPSAPVFGFRVDGNEWSDPTLNDSSPDDCSGGPSTCGHHVRFWPAKDRSGAVIPSTYIMAMDYAGINYDFNDNVYLITNIEPELADTPPAAPTALTATGTTNSVVLDWNNSPESDLAGYNIYRSDMQGGPFVKINSSLVTTSDYVDATTASGTLAFYVVTAVDLAANESPFSAEKHATRLEPITLFSTINWGTAAPQPFGNTEAQAAVVGGKMYVFSGFDIEKRNGPCGCFTPTKRAYVYDPVANSWTPIADLPFPNDGGTTHAGITTDGTDIILAGGYISNANNTGQIFGTKQVWRYNVGSNNYTRLPDLPVERAGGQLQYFQGKLYYFGGSNLARTQDVDTHYRLDYDAFVAGQNPTWTNVAAMPNGRHHMGSVVLNNLIYAIGGQHGHDGMAIPQASVHAYDPVTNIWSAKASLPLGRSHIPTYIHQGRIFVLGGEARDANGNFNIDDVTAYDPSTDTWSELTPLPVNRKSGIGASLEGNLYYSSGGLTTTTYKGVPGGGSNNQPPVASFTATPDGTDPLTINFDASTSTDDGTIVQYDWDFGDTTTGTGITTSHTFAAPGTYTVTLIVTDNGNLTGMTQQLIQVSSSTAPFQESGGQVVIEAENYHNTIPRSSHNWLLINPSGSVGAAMEATPNTNTAINTGYASSSPELQYQVDFATTGTYYVWARVFGPSFDDDSFHAGLDGQTPASADRIKTGTQGSWVWTNVTMDSNARATMSVPTAGEHVLNIWMREDGLQIDRLLLTTNAGFTPTGDGPSESPRVEEGGNQPPVASFTATPDGTDPLTIDFDASASTDDGTIVQYDWDFGDTTTGAGSTTSHTYADFGTYTVTLIITDDDALTDTSTQTIILNEPACEPYSTLECLTLPVDLPYTLTWDADHSGLDDTAGNGTGFTLVAPPSARFEGTPTFPGVPGYEPGNVAMNIGTGLLTITTTKGAFETEPAVTPETNAQLNALGVSFDAMQPAPFSLTTTLTDLPSLSGASASQQAGLWFGIGEDDYVKLAAFYDGNGDYRVQLSYELDAAIITEQNTENILTGNDNVVLKLEMDPAATTVRGFYSLNGGTNFTPLGAAFAIDAALFTGLTLPDGVTGPVSFAGLFATHFQSTTPLSFAFDTFDLREIPIPVQSPSVTGTSPADGETNIQRNGFVAADVHLPNVGQGIDESTLTSATVMLYPTGNPGTPVSANLNTSGGGDAIVLQPTLLLAANTPYTFEVTAGLRDLAGASFEPFSMSFTTGSDPTGPPNSNIRFEKVSFAGSGIGAGGRHPSLVIGPDNKLYATTITGVIKRWDINPDGTLSNLQQITSLQAAEGGNRLAIGLVFDPASTPTNLIAWVSHTTFGFSGMADWGGKISRLSGPNLETVAHYVEGLPRSIRDHVTNSLAFGPDGALYALQGSNSAMGAPDDAWGNRAERRLSAAVLHIDVATLAASGSLPLNVKTEEGGTYDSYAPNAPVKVFASGTRNAYDLVWHSNGDLYVPTNGSAANGNAPASVAGTIRPDGSPYGGPMIPAIDSVETQNDYLFRIPPPNPGGTWTYRYYGHPNPSRGEYVLNGGNPTSAADPAQVDSYPVGTDPDQDWQGHAYNFGRNISPNGVIEYQSNSFGGDLQGRLLVARYSGGDDIIVLTPDPSTKDISASGDIVGIQGFTGFVDPLDLVENPANGHIYVSEYGGGGQILLLRPLENQPPTASFVAIADSLDALTIHFDASASSDDATIVEYDWDFGDTTTGSGITTSHTYAAGGSYTVTLTVTDNTALTDSTMQLVNVNETGPFAESGGQVVVEGESFHSTMPRSNHAWTLVSPTGSVGAAMEATPNNNTNINTGYAANSPELTYQIDFTTTGTYYVWGRVRAATNSDDSFHTGLDGQTPASADRLTTSQYGVWAWTNTTMDSGARATLSVPSAGEHSFHVWMREDGLFIDRLLLTTDPNFIPSGDGPPESPRISQSGNQTPVASFTATPDGTDALTIHFDASASSDDGTIVEYDWDFGDTTTGSGITTSHTYAAGGSYTVTLTVTDDESATGTAQQTFFVSDGMLQVVAEAGQVTTDQSGPTQWHTVALTHSFTDPVVVMGPFSFNGGEPSTVRVRNVAASSFEFQLDEWDYLNGKHTTETVSYLVVEAGTHTLEDGRILQAGLTTVDATTTPVSFVHNFATMPVVVSQVVTTNGLAAVVTRQQNVSVSGFEMFLQEQQSGGIHTGEMVAWVALRPGVGTTGGRDYEAGITADTVTQTWTPIGFLGTFTQVPTFVAAMQTTDGADPATLRYQALTTTGTEVKVEEEQSADNETNHTTERVGYLAFSPGLIHAAASAPLTRIAEAETALATNTAALTLPEHFALHANYPNPFNPTTTIRYELPASASVQLEVFDVTGRRVARLVEAVQGAGRYEAVFEASELPSGVYFYRLQAGAFTHTEKMILLK